MTQTEALRLALEALEKLFGIPDKWTGEGEGDVAVWRLGGSYRAQQAIAAIKAALEAKDEPPRFPTMLRKMWSGTEVQEWVNENWQAPPQRTWVGLTDEEILKHQDTVPNSYSLDLIEFAQAIEAKLKEKNNG